MKSKKVAKSIKHPYDFWIIGLIADVCSFPRRCWGIFAKYAMIIPAFFI